MIVSQDLTIRAGADGLARLREALLESAAPPWRHDQAEESEMRRRVARHDVIVFRREAGDGIGADDLALWTTDDAYVVVRTKPGAVSKDEHRSHNALLMDFVSRVVEPASKLTAAVFKLTAPETSLQDLLPQESVSALHRFVEVADRGVGYGHFSGSDDWCDFLIAVHKSQGRFEARHLLNWLVNQEGWLEENAREFAGKFAFGLSLLGRYDRDPC